MAGNERERAARGACAVDEERARMGRASLEWDNRGIGSLSRLPK